MIEGEYSYSMNEEEYHGSCSTREEAFDEGQSEFDCDEPSVIYVGEIVEIKMQDLLPKCDAILDTVFERAYDIVGEISEYGFKGLDDKGSPTQYKAKKIEKEIAQVFVNNGIVPKFFSIGKVTEHKTNYKQEAE